MKKNNNTVYKDLKLIIWAKKLYKISKLISVLSVVFASAFIGSDILKTVIKRAQ